MKGIRSVFSVDLAKKIFDPLSPLSARDLKLKEKSIENWIAQNPRLLFTNPEAVLVISQELAGEPMADLLAADSQGALIVIEVKREWSDRSTVGQLLDYAAALSNWTYDDFNRRWQRNIEAKRRDLFEAFKEFAENPEFEKDEFLKSRRFFILASAGDESMKRIIGWLRDNYDVPIDFVPFQFYKQGTQHFLEIEKIDVDPIEPKRGWEGDWFFNTNETNYPDAYVKMFKDGTIAVDGYPNTEGILNGPRPGERIFAYVKGRGIAAVGRIGDKPACPSGAVFGQAENNEYNRKVVWRAVAKVEEAIKPTEVSEWGYNLPVRATLGKIYNGRVAEKIATELEKRARSG